MTTPNPLRVLIVDDHPIVRSGLRVIEALNPRLQVVGEAASVTEALAGIQSLSPDVVLLDLRLPDGSGVDVCRQVKRLRPKVRVICLTSFSDASLVLAALGAGADAYLLKHNDAERVIEVIRAVWNGEQVLDTPAGQTPETGIAPARPLDRLTPAERRVLEQVVRGLTDKEVALALNLSVKTIRNSLDRAFAKLGVHSRTQAALTYAERAGEFSGPSAPGLQRND